MSTLVPSEIGYTKAGADALFATKTEVTAATAASSVTGQYIGSAATYTGLPTTDAAGAAAGNGDWAALTADVVGTGTTSSPQYPRGIYVYNGTSYSLALNVGVGGLTATPTGTAGGDLAGTYPNPTLAAAGTAGTYGDGTHVPQITTDSKGRVTAVTPVTITGAAPSGTAGGDLTGSYPNPTLTTAGTAGTYGSGSAIPVITTDSKGRVTAVTTATPAGGTATDATKLAIANNLSDLASAATARTNLGLKSGATTAITVSTTAPSSPAVNDLWVDAT